MKRSRILLTFLALALVLSMGIGTAWSYFTATTRAAGEMWVHLDTTTDIEEPTVVNGEKHIVITNDEGSEPVYVRARAFAGASAGELTYSGEGWTDGGDGWYYYGSILEGGDASEELLVRISALLEDKDDLEDGDNFNVVVVYESTPVQYDADGVPFADWSLILDES